MLYPNERRQWFTVRHIAAQAYALAVMQDRENQAAENAWRKPRQLSRDTLTAAERKEICNILVELGERPILLHDESTAENPILLPRRVAKRTDEEGGWSVAHVFDFDDCKHFLSLTMRGPITPQAIIEIGQSWDTGAYYGGAGRRFSREGCTLLKRKRVVHYQSGGLDI